ncbi:MAG: hypothetical protein LBT93_07505 [Treponema sp.]|jgi:hypothetical protein|nr:hypothetical protein [Treponema sp.]
MQRKPILKKAAVLFFLFMILPFLKAQDAPENGALMGEERAEALPGTGEEGTLPRNFREFSLGMGLEDLKEALRRDGLFYFREDRDVSFLPSREESLVETTGLSFIRRAFFQLRDGKVFIMAFTLDPHLVDHYSVFTSLVKKYGEPALLDPKQAVWESADTRIAIERPLTVKYIDQYVFNEIINESKALESAEIRLREEFLSEF